MIVGGYILQPRIIQESDISVAPPYVREIWNYILREANSSDCRYNGFTLKRGQLFRSYEDIREGTKWFVGWRKCTYNENHTKKAMKFLRDTGRITTMKELGGVLITVCKYDYYQDSKNYERTTRGTKSGTIAEPMKNQTLPDNNKNVKNDKNNIYGEFYNSEIEKSNNDERYLRVVRLLYGENNLGIKLDVVLNIQYQLTYEQFKKLWYLKEKYKISFTEIFERIQDWGNPKKRKTVYGVFLTFAKSENPNIKLHD